MASLAFFAVAPKSGVTCSGRAMAIRSSKHATAIAQTITPSGGLNHSLPATDIADNELTFAQNVVYQPGSGILSVGPGASFVARSQGGATIRALHYYRKDSVTSFWVAAFGAPCGSLARPTPGRPSPP